MAKAGIHPGLAYQILLDLIGKEVKVHRLGATAPEMADGSWIFGNSNCVELGESSEIHEMDGGHEVSSPSELRKLGPLLSATSIPSHFESRYL